MLTLQAYPFPLPPPCFRRFYHPATLTRRGTIHAAVGRREGVELGRRKKYEKRVARAQRCRYVIHMDERPSCARAEENERRSILGRALLTAAGLVGFLET